MTKWVASALTEIRRFEPGRGSALTPRSVMFSLSWQMTPIDAV